MRYESFTKNQKFAADSQQIVEQIHIKIPRFAASLHYFVARFVVKRQFDVVEFGSYFRQT